MSLLAGGSRHGYQLKVKFDVGTGGAWPLNVGQVYSTLQRLERDGLVEPEGAPDAEGRISYGLTGDGIAAVESWFSRPAEQVMSTRDELPMKVMLAVATDVAPVLEVVGNERRAAMATLQDLTAMRADSGLDLAGRLQVDRMVFRTEAEVRWLDLVEERLLAGGVSVRKGMLRAAGDVPTSKETT